MIEKPRPAFAIVAAIVLIHVVTGAFAQSSNTNKTSCDCPKTQWAETKADTSFTLSNGKTIVLCGYIDTDRKPPTFSEFVLAACGQDTIIDFWDATLTCRIRVHKDTLFVEELRHLPTGKNLKYLETVWLTDKIYFDGPEVVKEFDVNRKIRKYSQTEITAVLSAYRAAKPGLDDSKMQLANKLFIATISGSKAARKYFIEFKNKFGVLDGAFKEEYSELAAMLELWDKK